MLILKSFYFVFETASLIVLELLHGTKIAAIRVSWDLPVRHVGFQGPSSLLQSSCPSWNYRHYLLHPAFLCEFWACEFKSYCEASTFLTELFPSFITLWMHLSHNSYVSPLPLCKVTTFGTIEILLFIQLNRQTSLKDMVTFCSGNIDSTKYWHMEIFAWIAPKVRCQGKIVRGLI